MLWGLSLFLISAGYLLVGRFFLSKLFFANNNCNGCGICAEHCPVSAIKMKGKKNPRPFWQYNCESCMRCAAFCPQNAIEAGHSWAVVLYFITTVPVAAYFFSWLNGHAADAGSRAEFWMSDLLDLIWFYPALFISYYIFSTMIRIPVVNRIFTCTTMTHLPFWGRYREPDTRLKDITVEDSDKK